MSTNHQYFSNISHRSKNPDIDDYHCIYLMIPLRRVLKFHEIHVFEIYHETR